MTHSKVKIVYHNRLLLELGIRPPIYIYIFFIWADLLSHRQYEASSVYSGIA